MVGVYNKYSHTLINTATHSSMHYSDASTNLKSLTVRVYYSTEVQYTILNMGGGLIHTKNNSVSCFAWV